jgi:hypothetical protein
MIAVLLSATALATPISTLAGSCPGPVSVSSTGLTPSGQVAVLVADGPGVGTVAGGPCAGAATGLSGGSTVLQALSEADADGLFSASPSLGAPACGKSMQLLDVASCTLSAPLELSGYRGGWPVDSCAADMVGTGDGLGEVAHDFALLDQHGDTVRLHDFCNHTVVLMSIAAWCGPCIERAGEVQRLHELYADEGAVMVALMGEGFFGDVLDVWGLESFATGLGLTYPVVADAEWAVTGRFVPPSFAIPTFHVVDHGTVVAVDDVGFDESDLRALLGL